MARTKAKKTKKKATKKASVRKTTTRKKPAKRAKTAKTAKRATTTKRKATKKTAKKRTTTKKTAKRTTGATTAIKAAWNKSQILTNIAESTELSKKEIAAVFDELSNAMNRHLRNGGAGEFTVPGLMKVVRKRKPATKARKGINPFTGEEIMFKAKPARNIIKIRPLKKLKEMVE